jgi:hypothetical protein
MSLPFDTLRLEGALFFPEILEKTALGDGPCQAPADYHLPKGLKLHDEYGRAFQIAQAQWKSFVATHERKDLDAATQSRAFITEFLRDALGYSDIAATAPIEIHSRKYPVGTLAAAGKLPVVIAPHTQELDTPDTSFAIEGGGARKKSPAQLLQEFLNASPDHTWGIVTNGRKIRLLRDSATLTRPSFLEADLETVLSGARYPDFAAAWRILQASRASASAGHETVWDFWRKEGQEQGTAVRAKMRVGVTDALLALGSGFLAHKDNDALRQRLESGALTKEAFFEQLLRLIYRWIVLATLEERELIHPPDDSPSAPAARKLYADGYGLRRLRSRAIRRSARTRHDDLWQAVRIVFKGLAHGEPRLALPGLGGIFAETQCPDLDSASLGNEPLLEAQFQLRWSRATGTLAPIDYRNMGTEELGSIYESLLELVPVVDLTARHFTFVGFEDDASSAGNARKLTGSHYTPDPLVLELVRSTLDPLIAATILAHPDDPIAALLRLTICDPACGSGHFLLAAARRLTEKIAELRHPDGYGDEAFRHALREVISRCIYGVDRNPMAIELARTALWLEGYEPGKPLSFLDHHLVCGDALLGLDRFEQMENGIPDAAFKPLSGDDRETCKTLQAINKAGKKDLERHRSGESAPFAPNTKEADVFAELAALEALPEDSPEQVETKGQAYHQFLEHARNSRLARAADCFTAAFLAPKGSVGVPPASSSSLESCVSSSSVSPTTRTLLGEISSAVPSHEREAHEEAVSRARELCRESFVLHWPLAFPHVFARGGFDCILGNPPWERIKLQEEEFFATRSPEVAAAKNKAERSKRIQWLSEGSLAYHLHQAPIPHGGNPAEIQLYQEFITARRLTEATSIFAHLKADEGGRFPLTGVGDVNTYALFAEAITRMTAPNGRAGFIAPTGIATDDSTKAFFGNIATSGRLASLFDFENRQGLFPAVDSRMKFCLLTIGEVSESSFAFFLAATAQLNDEPRRFTLTREDFVLINPNTRTCPVFRSRADAELTRAIYHRVPVLIREKTDAEKAQNPWGIRFATMFHMSNDSGLFQSQLGEDFLPLYEAKMIHQFDHRWAGYSSGSGEDDSSGTLTLEQKQDPAITAIPRYWVAREHVDRRLLDNSHPLYPLFLARLDQRRDQRRDQLAKWFRFWLWGHALKYGTAEEAEFLRKEIDSTRIVSHSVGELAFNFIPEQHLAQRMVDDFPLSVDEQTNLWTQIRADGGLLSTNPRTLGSKDSDELSPAWLDLAETILPSRDRHWLMGWRDICRATDERTVIASIVPRVGVGNKLPLIFSNRSTHEVAALLGNLCAIVFDYVARQKMGGTTLNFFIAKQLPILPPSAYAAPDLAFIVPRVLELTFTAHDLRPWAEDVTASWNRAYPDEPLALPAAPYRFDPDRRAELRAELDARYARLYGLTRDELRYILDPADTHGPDYPTETFRVLKNNDIKNHGHYRTQRLTLEAWDRMCQNT